MKSNEQPAKMLILQDIRSAQNVGALFRTADAVGIGLVYLSSITAKPIDRFGRPVQAISKTALGAEKNISWKTYDDIRDLILKLKKEGVQIVAIEQHERSVDYKNVVIKTPVVFILGNEVSGLSEEVLALADNIASIPMKGKKESLNVAVAGGVALYRILNI